MNDEIYYHAYQISGLSILKPHLFNHGIPLVNFSKKRGNVLAYLSNIIEKYCKETGYAYDGNYEKLGLYGFNRDGIVIDKKTTDEPTRSQRVPVAKLLKQVF